MRHFATLFVVVIIAFLSTSSFSQTLFFEENFNYPPGQLTTVSGGNWVNFSGTGYFIQVSSGDLTYPGYLVAGGDSGKITLVTNTASAEDIQRSFDTMQTGVVFASMLINVLDTTMLWPNSSSNGDYFAGFLPPTGTSYCGRLCIKRSTNDSTFLLGIRAVSSSTPVWSAGEYLPGTTYLVVISYGFVTGATNDSASLWINPDLSGTMPPADATSIAAGTEPVELSRLFFRQAYTSGSGSTPNVDIDKIRMADDWILAPIPVELKTFTGIANGNEVILNWSTASELNNKGFEVQRSSQHSEFTAVGFISGYGTSTESHSYSFVDQSLAPGQYSYRLKQIDYNGQFEYSSTVSVFVDQLPADYALSQNYPNPFNPTTNISYTLPVESHVTLKIFNIIGQEIKVLENSTRQAGSHSVKWDADGNTSGIYFYSLETTSGGGTRHFKTIKKMILQK